MAIISRAEKHKDLHVPICSSKVTLNTITCCCEHGGLMMECITSIQEVLSSTPLPSDCALEQGSFTRCSMSRDARKPVFGVSDQLQHKPACTITETG